MNIKDGIDFYEDIARLEYDLVDTFHTDEGVYGRAESYHREKAEHHEQVAIWLKELQAHRAGWDRMANIIKDLAIKEDRKSDTYDCYNFVLDMINNFRPKEGDAE